MASSLEHRNIAEILERLVFAAEKEHFPNKEEFRVYFSCSSERAAVSDGFGDIYITRGLLNAFDNDGQLYATLAHELSHYLLKHFSDSNNFSAQSVSGAPSTVLPHESAARLNINEKDEIAADQLSLRLLHRSGFASQHAAPSHRSER